jgi:hypothetical protein
MPPIEEQEREEVSSGDHSAMRALASEVAEARRETPEPEDRPRRPEREDTGPSYDPEDRALKPREAARDLQEQRYQEWKAQQDEAREEVETALSDKAPEVELPAADTAEAEARRVAEEQANAAAFEERRRATEAREQQEQYRTQWMQAVHAQWLLASQQILSEFPELQQPGGLERLAATDPDKFARVMPRVEAARALAGKLAQVDAQVRQESQQNLQKWAEVEDAKFIQQNPEFRDAANAPKLRQLVVEDLRHRGVTDTDLSALWNMQSGINIRDARVQSILLDAARYRQVKAASKNVATKPLPPVQRPGVATSSRTSASERVEQLSAKLGKTNSLKDAVKLRAAQIAARRR